MKNASTNLGRPKKDPAERRTETVMIWLTKREKQDLTEALMKREGPGTSMSSFVASLVKTELKRRGIAVGNP